MQMTVGDAIHLNQLHNILNSDAILEAGKDWLRGEIAKIEQDLGERSAMVNANFKTLESLLLPHGLYKASTSDDYNRVWIRDSVYMAFAYMNKTCGTFERTVHGMLDLFRSRSN